MGNYVDGLVSVIIPTYKRSDSIERSIVSVLNQTYTCIECVLVNDNYPDDEYSMILYEKIKPFMKDSRFVFLEQEVHINGAAARNFGIMASKGEFVAFLDDDDWWKLDKIEKQVAKFRDSGTECGLVSTLVEFYSNGLVKRKSNPYREGYIFREILGRDIDVVTSSVMVKHEALDNVSYFDEKLRRHQEIQLLSFLTSAYALALVPEWLTCMDIDSSENKPDSTKLRKIKEDFFESVNPVLSLCSKSEVKRIKALHRFELGYVEFGEGKKASAFRDMLSVLKSPSAIAHAFARIVRRLKERAEDAA